MTSQIQLWSAFDTIFSIDQDAKTQPNLPAWQKSRPFFYSAANLKATWWEGWEKNQNGCSAVAGCLAEISSVKHERRMPSICHAAIFLKTFVPRGYAHVVRWTSVGPPHRCSLYSSGRGPYSIGYMNQDTWAEQNLIKGRIWRAGRTLDMPDLYSIYNNSCRPYSIHYESSHGPVKIWLRAAFGLLAGLWTCLI